MVKVNGPAMSLTASGQFGKELIFSRRRSGQLVRQFHKPSGPRTIDQLAQREIMAGLTAYWQCKSASEKAVYNDLANESKEGISGYNLFIRMACADLRTHYGLIGFWPMDEGTGSKVYNKTGVVHTGTIVGATWENGMIGKGLNFTATPVSYVDIPDSDSLEVTTQVSMTFWVRSILTTSAPAGAVYAKYFYSGALGFFIGLASSRLVTFITGFNGYTATTKTGLRLNQWTHVAVTFQSGIGAKIYFDGVEKTPLTVTRTPNPINDSSGRNARFGRRADATQSVRSTLDDIRLYNRVLSAAEIKKLSRQVFK